MPFWIIQDDITKVSADAVVNAANPALRMGGGVCGAIFRAAGEEELQRECDLIGGCLAGEAVITRGYGLPAKYVIHTPGPVWQGGDAGEEEILAACYRNSLELAKKRKLHSVAFPLISSGVYGYPKDQALQVAVRTIREFLSRAEMDVSLVVTDRSAVDIGKDRSRSIDLFLAAASGISDLSAPKGLAARLKRMETPPAPASAAPVISDAFSQPSVLSKSFDSSARKPRTAGAVVPRILEEQVNNAGETFSGMLLRLIDEKGKTDVEIYKRANMDRKLFSKIRSNTDYQPGKRTAVAFAVALELSLDETRDLLLKAGFALSHASKFDIIVEYFIREGNYDIFEINQALFAFEQNLLGA